MLCLSRTMTIAPLRLGREFRQGVRILLCKWRDHSSRSRSPTSGLRAFSTPDLACTGSSRRRQCCIRTGICQASSTSSQRPLSLGCEKCRKPFFERGPEIVGERMRRNHAAGNLGNRITGDAKHSNQKKPCNSHMRAQLESSYFPMRFARLLSLTGDFTQNPVVSATAMFHQLGFRMRKVSTIRIRTARQFLLQIFWDGMTFAFVIPNEDQSNSSVTTEVM